MSSWQVILKQAALVCLKSAGKALADEAAKKIVEQIETNENVQNFQNKIMDGRGFDAASNVYELFKGKSDQPKA